MLPRLIARDLCLSQALLPPFGCTITRKLVPIARRASSPNKYFLINNQPILIRSMLAAGIVQDKFAREAEGGEEETTGGATSTLQKIIVKTTVLVHLTILK